MILPLILACGLSLQPGHILGYDRSAKLAMCEAGTALHGWAPKAQAAYLHWRDVDTGAPHAAVGLGAAPVGFRIALPASLSVTPAVGFLYFTQRVLSAGASKMMFTASLGASWRWRKVQFSYRYMHLSNANMAGRNPGTDANLWSVGVRR